MKIIISNKCRQHMQVHEKDFLYNWEELLANAIEARRFENLQQQFEIIRVDFQDKNIGYSNLVESSFTDEIVFAKRKGRDIYTKFVKNRSNEIVKSILVLLNRSKSHPKEYYLVTMFPGLESQKEPEDTNISTEKELIQCLEFWSHHALVYDTEIIQKDSLLNYCPYNNLYSSIA